MLAEASDRAPAAAGRATILILGLLTALGPLAIDLYLPGLPDLARDLHVGPGAAQRTVAIFFLGTGLGQSFIGPLADRIGRRIPLCGGLVLFAAASVGCATASSITMLLAMRLLQALGGCVGLVIARAIVSDRFAVRETAGIYSMLALILGISPILAPLIGGWLLLIADWRAIFWILAAIGAALAVLVTLFIPESRSRETARLAKAETPWRSYRQMLAGRNVVGFIMVGSFAAATMPIYVSSAPSVLIGGYGVSAQHFGWYFGINGLGLVAGSSLSGLMSRRHRPEAILQGANWAALLLAAAMLIAVLTGAGGMFGLLIPLFGVIVALGVSQPNALAGAMSREPHRAGSVAALLGSTQFIIGALCAVAASALIDGSAVPMAAIIFATAAVAVILFMLIRPASVQGTVAYDTSAQGVDG